MQNQDNDQVSKIKTLQNLIAEKKQKLEAIEEILRAVKEEDENLENEENQKKLDDIQNQINDL